MRTSGEIVENSRSPKLVASVLIGGTIVLVGGGAAAATLPGPASRMMKMTAMAGANPVSPASASRSVSPMPSVSDSVAPSQQPDVHSKPSAVPRPTAARSPFAAMAAAPKVPLSSSAARDVTYVVRHGDTLSGIAAWFRLHGYGDLYAWNASRIGSDPNLIIPGERITISDGVMTVGRP